MNVQRLFLYDHWANREVFEVSLPGEAVRLLAHIIGAEWLWLSRLTGAPPKMAVWPELTREQCAAQIEPLRESWAAYLSTADPSSSISYMNTKGERWTSVVGDVLTHVVIHGAYHRGQIASAVRAAGSPPPYTDYIHCTRIGAI
jgi:uncharacterized damage-inducible protein DinB